MAQADIGDIAAKVIAALKDRSRVSCFHRPDGLTLRQAYQITPLLRAAFEAEGEDDRPEDRTRTGRCGARSVFNRRFEDSHDQPHDARPDRRACGFLGEFAEPRIEPEIIFGLKAARSPR